MNRNLSTVYLDYNATTPVDPQVLEAMLPYFHEDFGNSVSAAHAYGWRAEKAVEKARSQVAELLNCEPQEIFFTGGASESNNWALRGLVDQLRAEGPEPIHMISSPLEHSSVVKTLCFLETQSVEVSWAKVDACGHVQLDSLAAQITPQTKLMSFMWINNEIGAINPVLQMATLARENKVYFHCDATQALGKIAVDLKAVPIDMLSFSAHKIYGPKGVGVMYLRSRDPKVQIKPLIYGGGHERGARSGTLNVPGIVGLGEACAMIKQSFETEQRRIRDLRDQFWADLKNEFPLARLNGPDLSERAINNLNVTFSGCYVPPTFADVAVSRGSACHSGATHPSPVLNAIGVSADDADKTLRMTLGRWTTGEDLQRALQALKSGIRPQ